MKNKLLICLLISLQVIISEKLFAGANEDIAYSIESGLERLHNNEYPSMLYLSGENCPKPNQYQDLSKFKNLYSLHFSGCKMGKIPKAVFQMKHLSELYLSDNELTELPAEIGKLKGLNELDLSKNHIKKLPESIGKLIELKKLYLNDNALTALPEIMGKLMDLRELQLNNNQLSSLPKSSAKWINIYILESDLPISENPFWQTDTYIVNASPGLSVRMEPNLKAEKIGLLTEKLRVAGYEEGPREKIDGFSAPWIKIIALSDGKYLEGWSWGGYLQKVTGIELTRINRKKYSQYDAGSATLRISEGVTKIMDGDTMRLYPENGVFQKAEQPIRRLILPSSLLYIGHGAFAENQIAKVQWPENLKTIGISAFAQNQLTELKLPSSVEIIESRSFLKNKLVSVDLRNCNIKKINYKSFRKNQIKELHLPNSVVEIEMFAFWGNRLERVKLPQNLKVLGGFGDNRIQEIELPPSVKTIDSLAFINNKITSITIPEATTHIGSRAFEGNQIERVVIHSKKHSSYLGAFRGNPVKKLWVSKDLYERDGKSSLSRKFDGAPEIILLD